MLLFKLKVHVTASFSANLRSSGTPGHDIDKRQRKISRAAPYWFVHGSQARGRAAEASLRDPQCVRQKQTNGRQWMFVRKKSSFVKISNE